MEGVTRTSYEMGVKNFKTYSFLFTKWLKDFTENIFQTDTDQPTRPAVYFPRTCLSVVQCPNPELQEALYILL